MYVIHPTGGILKFDPNSGKPSTQEAKTDWEKGPKGRCNGKPCMGIAHP
jgi:hypothetical protein